MKGPWMLLAACGLACATARRPSSAAENPDEQRAVEQWQEARESLRSRRGADDCGEVCRLSELICRASERLCAIAARHGGEPGYGEPCEAARRDCEDARGQCGACR